MAVTAATMASAFNALAIRNVLIVDPLLVVSSKCFREECCTDLSRFRFRNRVQIEAQLAFLAADIRWAAAQWPTRPAP